jgi:lysozyme
MARIPTWEELGQGGPRPVRAPVNGDVGGQEVAQGIKKIGSAMTDVGDDVIRQQNFDDVLNADDNHLKNSVNLVRSFDNDPDYATFNQRAQIGLDDITAQSAAMIRDPVMRQRWVKRAQRENYSRLDQVTRLGDTMLRQDAQASLNDNLDTRTFDYLNADTDEQRDQIKREMQARIDAGVQQGLIRPLVARQTKEKYIDGLQVLDANKRMSTPEGAIELLKEMQGAGSGSQPSSGRTSDAGYGLIRDSEGYAPVAARDTSKGYSVGYGTFGVRPGTKMSRDEAEAAMRQEVSGIEDQLAGAIKVPITQGQHDALVDAFYNLGTGKGRLEKIAGMINSGRADQVPKYLSQLTHDADGNRLDALVERRAKEIDLFNSGGDPVDYSQPQTPSNQVADASGNTAPSTDLAPVPTANRYSGLSPKARAHIEFNARKALSDFAQVKLKGDVLRLESGFDEAKDDEGHTAFENFSPYLQPNQVQKYKTALDIARMKGDAITPLSDLSTSLGDDGLSPAEEHLMQFAPHGDMSPQDFYKHHVVAEAADAAWTSIKKKRDDDPAASVSGFSDTKRNYPASQEVADAQKFVDTAAPDLWLGSDGGTYVSADGQKVSGVQAAAMPQTAVAQKEHLIEARLAAQTRVGINPNRQKIITKQEADELLQLPSKWDDMSDDDLSTALTRAAQRSMETYGPEYGERAFDEAVRFAHAGKDEKTQAIELGAALASGRMNMDDLRKAMFAPKNEGGWLSMFSDEEPEAPDDTDGKNDLTSALAMRRREAIGSDIPDFSPWTDTGMGETQPFIGTSQKLSQPNQQQIDWLKQNPGSAKLFDSHFNQPGLSARILSGQ